MKEYLDQSIEVIDGVMCATIKSSIDDGNYHLYTDLSYTVYYSSIEMQVITEVTRHGHILHRCQRTYSYRSHESANEVYSLLLEDTGFNNLED